jgi:bifunctional DNA-binding transcriptional regulator/antitoxin component of YhaV-PrlF toxin-antitoxin module
VLALLVAGAWAGGVRPVAAQQPAPPPQQPRAAESGVVREVRRGDTLWDLARECLGDPYRWPEIYRLNTGIVADPDLIYPRESLTLPACGAGVATGAGARTSTGPVAARVPSRSIFYREEGQQASVSTLSDELIASAPLTTTGEFYHAGILVHERDLKVMGTVEGVRSPTVLPVRSAPQIQPNDRIYLRIAFQVKPGDRLHFLRRGREVRPYGSIYVSTGIGTVEEVKDGTAVVEVDQLFNALRPGDIAVTLAEFRAPMGETLSEVWGPSGRILAFETPSPVRQLHDLAFVDLGRQFGVKEGDELEVYLPEAREKWGVRPEVRVARLRVVRATERTSTAQVIGMDQPALEAGLPVRLVARAP